MVTDLLIVSSGLTDVTLVSDEFIEDLTDVTLRQLRILKLSSDESYLVMKVI